MPAASNNVYGKDVNGDIQQSNVQGVKQGIVNNEKFGRRLLANAA